MITAFDYSLILAFQVIKIVITQTVAGPKWAKVYCRSGNICKNLIFTNIHELAASRIQRVTISFIEYMDTHSRIQELANNSEIENLRNKSHAKISEFTVFINRLY